MLTGRPAGWSSSDLPPPVAPIAEIATASISGLAGISTGAVTSLELDRRRNIAYESDTGGTHRLDVYLPTGERPEEGWPVVLAIHGGGWRRLGKEGYGRRAAVLTASGFAVVAPDYTLTRRGIASWPRNIEDLRGAIRWARENASAFGLDPDRIAAMGESAGAHLALLLGMMPDLHLPGRASANISVVVDFFGPTDLLRLEATSPSAAPAVRGLVGARRAGALLTYKAASPIEYASPSGPPVLLIHGQRDAVVPISQSELLAQALRSNHVPHTLIAVPQGGHGFGLQTRGMNLLAAVVDFLDLHLPRHAARPAGLAAAAMRSR